MPPMLDQEEVRESLLPFSVELYHELGRLGLLDENVELLDGFIFRRAPKPPIRMHTIRSCAAALRACLPEGHFLMQFDPLTLARSEPEPALAVVMGDSKDFCHQHPATAVLVIEVSVGTLERDRCKVSIYADAGVLEYWLIEPEAKLLTVCHLPEADGYREVATYAGLDTVASQVLAGFALNLSELFESSEHILLKSDIRLNGIPEGSKLLAGD